MTSLTENVRRGFLQRTLNRGDLGLLLLAAFFIAAQPPLSTAASTFTILDALARQNLFFYFAVFVAAKRFLAISPALVLSRGDWVLAGLASLLFGVVCLFGVDLVAGLVLTLVLVPLYFSGRRDQNFNSALLVLIALAINSFWGPLMFQTFTGAIIGLDTTLLKWTYGVLRPDIVSSGTTFQSADHFGIIVIGGCSVFNSASVAFLASTSMAQNLKPGLRWRDGLVLALVLLAMFGINTFRLALMGWGSAYYEYWHNGSGGPVFSAAQTVLIAAIALAGARWSIKESG